MRIGHNPLAGQVAPHSLNDIVLTCVTHLPNQSGYHAGRMEVIQTCLTSMREHADAPHSIAIWDNGSCPELREWLQDVFKPDVLILSENIGKNTARSMLFRMQHPNSVIGFCDDDIYFYHDWLSPQLEILRRFPNVACVTGYPVRTAFRWGNVNTKAWASVNAKLEYGRFIPDEWERDFAVSIGRDIGDHTKSTVADTDVKITYNGLQAYATSHHCQLLTTAKQMNRLAVFDNQAMASDRPFDEALDRIGLRLATINRYTRHIGNVFHAELKKEIEAIRS